MSDLPRCDAPILPDGAAAISRSPRSWSWPSQRAGRTVERHLVGPAISSAWQALAAAEGLADAGVVELSRSFSTTDDSMVGCMTCGVVGRVSDLRIRTVHHLAPERSDGPRQTLVSIACPVCSTRGSVVVTSGPTVPFRTTG